MPGPGKHSNYGDPGACSPVKCLNSWVSERLFLHYEGAIPVS